MQLRNFGIKYIFSADAKLYYKINRKLIVIDYYRRKTQPVIESKCGKGVISLTVIFS